MGHIHSGDSHFMIEPVPAELQETIHSIKGSSLHNLSENNITNSLLRHLTDVQTQLISGVRSHIIYKWGASSNKHGNEHSKPCGHDQGIL